MNFKIIETGAMLPDVLLFLNRIQSSSNEFVVIKAVGTHDDIENIHMEESVEFEDSESARCFIKDYSLDSATKWCNKMNIKY